MKLTRDYIRKIMRETVKGTILTGKEDYMDEIEEDIETLPIIINSRFSRTLGQFHFKRTPVGIVPTGFKFAKCIENYPKEIIDGIIKHELMHLIAGVVYCDDCGHDARWKDICRVYRVKPSATVQIPKENISEQYKYTLRCPVCGEEWSRGRLNRGDKEYFEHECDCTKCGHIGLEVIKNY